MDTGDLFGDLRERRIRRADILESIFRYCDSVGASVPFAHQPGARLQAETWICSNPAFSPKHFRESLQPTPRRFAEPAMLDFLDPVSDSSDQQVTTDPGWIAPKKPSPFMAKLVKARLARQIGQVEDTFGKTDRFALPRLGRGSPVPLWAPARAI